VPAGAFVFRWHPPMREGGPGTMSDDGDRRIQCVDCGEEFVFTAGEQAFYAARGLANAPTRCKRCRELRRQRADGAPRGSGASRDRHTAVCAQCGAETEVPFAPVPGRPVYCRNCYESRRPARAERGGGAPRSAGPRSGGPRPGGPRSAGPRPAAATGGPAVGQGTVKWFNEAKGFGFIRDDSGEELFVHSSAVRGDGAHILAEGRRVAFDVVMGPKGRQAANVTPLD
jgi:CxxC-x17-CxxC domain-containing protein